MKKYIAPKLSAEVIETNDIMTASAVQFDSVDNWLSDPFSQEI